MHSGVRVACLLLLALALPVFGPLSLGAALLVILAALVAIGGGPAVERWRTGMWRLRWLLFAIVALYLWQSPGDPIWPQLPGLTDVGLHEASRRVLILACLLAAVLVLIESTPAQGLAAGLIWLCAPLRPLRVPVDRLALRIALAFEAVREAQVLTAGLRGSGGLIPAAAAALETAERGELVRGPVPGPEPAGRPGGQDLFVLTAAALALIALHLSTRLVALP